MRDSDSDFVERLARDFPEVEFRRKARKFSFRLYAGKPVVFLGEPQPNFALLTLHELGHALCKHKDYTTDVQRIKIEYEAWERAKMVILDYRKKAFAEDGGVIDEKLAEMLPKWDEELVQEKLDTYRDWLHAKSKCKSCGLTRYQTEGGDYHCPRCEAFLAR